MVRATAIYIFLIVLFFAGVFCNVNTGSVHISPLELIKILTGRGYTDEMAYNVIWKIRLPRLLLAALFGGALSISGYLLQTFFKNPIAGPDVLGISSGAKLFVGFIMLANLGRAAAPYELFIAAFAGALLSMALVLLISKKVENISMLLVIGIMIGYICNSATDFLINFSGSEELQNFTMWSMGSFSGATFGMLKVSAIVVIPSVFVVCCLSKPLSAYLLGENYAKSVGVDIKIFRFLLIVLSSILTACVTAFAGPVAFVGIAVPHIARLSLKTSSPCLLVPAIFLLGCSFCLFCDLIARTAFAPTEISISTITSFIGAPIVISLMVKRRNRI
jgi:iron complex transport system permease protein